MPPRKPKSAPRARAARPHAAASPGTALVTRAVGPAGGAAVVHVEPAGLAMLKRVAAKGASRRIAAAALGISRKTLDKLVATDEAVGIAWESGAAVDEQFHIGVLRAAASKGVVIASIFSLKARHGWRENEEPQGNVTNLQVVLPGPMTPAQYAIHLAARDAAAQAALPAPPIDAESVDVPVATGRAVR